jgi:UDP-glucuronate 4-epimerase
LKTLVTGAAGFIGSTLARKLLDEGHEVVGVDSLTDYYDVFLKIGNLSRVTGPGFTFLNSDLNELDLDELLAGVDVVFHQAGQPGVRKSWGSDFRTYTRQNVEVTQRLLEAATRTSSIKKFVYASSSSVYGNAERYPTEESDRPQPVSPYGVTKLAAEHLCSLYASNYGLPTVSLRYFTVYGPRQRPDMAFTRFVRAAVLGDEITIYGNGEQVRDFTFVDDVVRANILAATSETIPGEVLNVAGGTNISVNSVLELIEAISGDRLAVKYEPTVNGDVFRTGGSTHKIGEVLGWQPLVNIEDGLTRHFEWAKSVFTSSARETTV